jgi:DNA repair exonuclease SbcCD nuclease subunit
MPFAWVKGDDGAELRSLRLSAIDRLAELSEEREADFVVIAGDLFDANSVEHRVVIRACERFKRFTVPVLVIPGNHDYCAGPEAVYRRTVFREHRPEHLVVLNEPEPLLLEDAGAVVLPAPLRRRHAVGDTTVHMTDDFGHDVPTGSFRIGLAHGAVSSFGAGQSEALNQVPTDRAVQGGLDYLALGDWHSTMEVNERTWYSGTPEATSFNEPDSGNALIVEIEAPGSLPRVEAIPIGRSRWLRHEVELTEGGDLDALAAWFAGIEAVAENTLVRLETTGTLSLAEIRRLEAMLDSWSGKLRHLRRRGPGVLPSPTDDEIDRIAGDGYVRTAVERLRELMGAEERSTAGEALALLYRLHAEVEESAEC